MFPREYTTLLTSLARPGAFPFALPGDSGIPIVQTHASAVLLTPKVVYKLKKPKNYGFFDYSTPALRRHFCIQEVRLNSRLAPHIYLGVAPVLAYADDTWRFGPTPSIDDVPEPGSSYEGGEVVDYAVVMVHLPDEATLAARIRNDTVSPASLAAVARYLAAFHASTQTNEHIASFGMLDNVRQNWEENFEQMRPYIGRTLDTATYNRITAYSQSFMHDRAALFAERIRDGRIRDCHGDLRLQHVYIFDETVPAAAQQPELAILDCIEFNERFRYSDVAAEVAFLAMELDHACRSDLAQAFVDAYIQATGDEAMGEALPFYLCYRACVRGKVTSFQLDGSEVPEAQRIVAQREANEFFQLAAHYAGGPTKPMLLMVGGLMGTGKTTLAQAFQQQMYWPLLSSDTVRKRLAHLDPAQPQAEAFGQGIYSHEWTARTYHALREEASSILARGCSVVIDAAFLRRADRDAIAREAIALGADVAFVECICPQAVVLQRLAQRWQRRVEGAQSAPTGTASDGRPDLYEQQRLAWEAFNPAEEQAMQHIVITTTLPPVVNVEQICAALHIPHLLCTLEPQ